MHVIYRLEGQGKTLEQEVYLTTPIKIQRYLSAAVYNLKKSL